MSSARPSFLMASLCLAMLSALSLGVGCGRGGSGSSTADVNNADDARGHGEADDQTGQSELPPNINGRQSIERTVCELVALTGGGRADYMTSVGTEPLWFGETFALAIHFTLERTDERVTFYWKEDVNAPFALPVFDEAARWLVFYSVHDHGWAFESAYQSRGDDVVSWTGYTGDVDSLEDLLAAFERRVPWLPEGEPSQWPLVVDGWCADDVWLGDRWTPLGE